MPLPRLTKSTAPPNDLSFNNCPVTFRPFLTVWSETVPSIQALSPEHQHDLARIICGLPPISNPNNPTLPALAADLRAVAIEISMRRTFQDRYAGDLQAALDAGSGRVGSRRVKASFVPPPSYEATSPTASTLSLPTPPLTPRSPSPSPSSKSFRSVSPLPSPSILGPEAPAIELIRETLYAALADVLERQPLLRKLLKRDPTRAYFASVALAILDVAVTSVTTKSADEPAIRGVLGKELALSDCPPALRPFMRELCEIGKLAHECEEEDSLACVQALSEGRDAPVPRMDRAKEMMIGGVGWEHDVNHEREPGAGSDPRSRRTSFEGRATAFANRVNALALGMTRLSAFRERQDAVFKVLIGVGNP